MMAWLPCTVAKVAPLPDSARTAERTVSGTSKNFRSTKYLLVARHQPVEQLEVVAGHEQFESDLVEADGIAQLIDHGARLVCTGTSAPRSAGLRDRYGVVRTRLGWKHS
jgi:hypothetical protein